MIHLKKLALCFVIFSSQFAMSMDEEPSWQTQAKQSNQNNATGATLKSESKKSRNSNSSISVRVTSDDDETGSDENILAQCRTVSLSSIATSTQTAKKKSFCSWLCCKREKDDNLLAESFSTDCQK